MLIQRKELDRFKVLINDLATGVIPDEIRATVFTAFLCQNPHLLMTDTFDEHMQVWLSIRNRGLVLYDAAFLPLLEFRTLSGRWTALLHLQQDESMLFAYNVRK